MDVDDDCETVVTSKGPAKLREVHKVQKMT